MPFLSPPFESAFPFRSFPIRARRCGWSRNRVGSLPPRGEAQNITTFRQASEGRTQRGELRGENREARRSQDKRLPLQVVKPKPIEFVRATSFFLLRAKLAQEPEKRFRSSLESRKHGLQVLIPEIPRHDFAEHHSKVGRNRQVAAFIQQRLLQARPAPIHAAALYRAAEYKHDVRVAVVSTAVAVFACRAAEFGHGYDDRVLSEIAQ